jgi:hypothetical protein
MVKTAANNARTAPHPKCSKGATGNADKARFATQELNQSETIRRAALDCKADTIHDSWRLTEFDPYAQIETMHRCHGNDGSGPNGGEHWGRGKSTHSYSVCRNRMSESGAWNRPILMSGASRRARAFCFIARSAST